MAKITVKKCTPSAMLSTQWQQNAPQTVIHNEVYLLSTMSSFCRLELELLYTLTATISLNNPVWEDRLSCGAPGHCVCAFFPIPQNQNWFSVLFWEPRREEITWPTEGGWASARISGGLHLNELSVALTSFCLTICDLSRTAASGNNPSVTPLGVIISESTPISDKKKPLHS